VLINAALAGVLANSKADQQTYTLGVRWDFRRDAAIKAQIDAIRGTRDSKYATRNESPDWNGKTNVFSLTLDFVF
jgi:long-subunit fatty acid transport protein